MKFFDFLYYIFYKLKGGPADGTIGFVVWIYIIVGYYVCSVIFDFPFLQDMTIYILGGASIITYIFFYFIYKDTEEMKKRMVVFEDINKGLLFITVLSIYLLPIIVFLITLYIENSKQS